MNRRRTTTPGAAPTAREADVLRYVRMRIRAYQEAPTRGEIAAYFGFSRPVAEQHLQALAAKGQLVLVRRWRGIHLPMRATAPRSQPRQARA